MGSGLDFLKRFANQYNPAYLEEEQRRRKQEYDLQQQMMWAEGEKALLSSVARKDPALSDPAGILAAYEELAATGTKVNPATVVGLVKSAAAKKAAYADAEAAHKQERALKEADALADLAKKQELEAKVQKHQSTMLAKAAASAEVGFDPLPEQAPAAKVRPQLYTGGILDDLGLMSTGPQDQVLPNLRLGPGMLTQVGIADEVTPEVPSLRLAGTPRAEAFSGVPIEKQIAAPEGVDSLVHTEARKRAMAEEAAQEKAARDAVESAAEVKEREARASWNERRPANTGESATIVRFQNNQAAKALLENSGKVSQEMLDTYPQSTLLARVVEKMNDGSGGLSPEAAEFWARAVIQKGGDLSGLGFGPTLRTPIMEQVTKQAGAAGMTPEDMAVRGVEFKADAGSLQKQTARTDFTRSFVSNIDKQISVVEDKVVPLLERADARILNIPWRAFLTKIGGSGIEAELGMYLKEISNEVAKLSAGSAESVAQLAEGNRQEWDAIHDPNLPVKDLLHVLKASRHAAGLRLESMEEAKSGTRKRMERPASGASAGGDATAKPAKGPARPSGVPANARWSDKKGGWWVPTSGGEWKKVAD